MYPGFFISDTAKFWGDYDKAIVLCDFVLYTVINMNTENKEPKPSKTRSIRLPPDLEEWTDQQAKESGRSFNGFINWLLRREKRKKGEGQEKEEDQQ